MRSRPIATESEKSDGFSMGSAAAAEAGVVTVISDTAENVASPFRFPNDSLS